MEGALQLRATAAILGVLVFLPTVVPAPAPAQEAESLAALVRITGTRGGERMPPGSGFVVTVDGDRATIVTAAHVIEGARFEVQFTTSPDRFPVEQTLGLEAGEVHGLAAFRVRGIPGGVTVLEIDTTSRLRPGEDLLLAGFPERASRPRVKQGVFSGTEGSRFLVDRAAGEGASGGPVLRGGKAVGVITAGGAGEEYTHAVDAVVVQRTLAGWGVEPCRFGEERAFEGIGFVRVCAGTFTMGSADDDARAYADEKPAHRVTLSEYWIGKYEVTNEQFRRFRADHEGAANLPATQVSWYDARDFCESDGFRLPTEAEWEYAARAGSQAAWSFGDDESNLGFYAWYLDELDHSLSEMPPAFPVGQKQPNAWGLYDMHGNVAEWVSDWYGPYSSEAQTDPTGPAKGEHRVVRGGSYSFEADGLRSANRVIRTVPEDRYAVFGFRCARSPRR